MVVLDPDHRGTRVANRLTQGRRLPGAHGTRTQSKFPDRYRNRVRAERSRGPTFRAPASGEGQAGSHAVGVVTPWAILGVLLVGDAAGHVSPATGGGVQLAFRLGRRVAHAIADHQLDLAPANALMNMMLSTAAMRFLARHPYFHRRRSSAQPCRIHEAEWNVSDSP